MNKEEEKAYEQGFIAGAHTTGVQSEEIMAEKLASQKDKVLKELLTKLQERKTLVIYNEVDWNEKGRRTGNWELGYDDAMFDAEKIIEELK